MHRSILLLALTGCPAPADECKLPSGTAAEIVAVDSTNKVTVIHDGDPVPLLSAPQGGHILLVGLRLQLATSCEVDANGILRDTTTNRVLGSDNRTLYLTTTGDGFTQPDPGLSAMPNVPVCPTNGTMKAVDGNPYQLEVSAGSIDAKVMVIPTCAPDDSYCPIDCGSQTSAN